MSHWAEINEAGRVVRVTVGNNNDPGEGLEWLEDNLGGYWLQTSYNTRGGVHYDPETGEPSADQSKAFRGNYAGIGFTYDEDLDAFIPPKPTEDATFDEDTYSWIVPEVEDVEAE
jgi:hypothetical protein